VFGQKFYEVAYSVEDGSATANFYNFFVREFEVQQCNEYEFTYMEGTNGYLKQKYRDPDGKRWIHADLSMHFETKNGKINLAYDKIGWYNGDYAHLNIPVIRYKHFFIAYTCEEYLGAH
jgi:major membrane immunogen (membrane-anchored lipoprotein)